MNRTLLAAAVALTLPLLAACSPSDTPADPATPAPTNAAAPTSQAAPDIDPGNDPFCALAVNAKGTADEINAQTEGMSDLITDAITTNNITNVNQWGTELVALDEEMLQFFADGRPYVEDDDVIGAWDTYTQFVEDYSLAVATEASNATSVDDFVLSMSTIVSNPDIQAAVNFGPAAAGAVGEYITTRCGTAN
jgi:hypothetical protein